MKKFILLIATTLIGYQSMAQIEGYNTWSVEANFGLTGLNTYTTNPTLSSNITPAGYFSHTLEPFRIDVSARKMLSDKFGFRLGLSFDRIHNAKNSLPFMARFTNLSLQGVINLNNLLDFQLFNNRVGFLAFGGVGAGIYSLSDRFVVDDTTMYDELYTTGTIGLTAQVRITDRFVFNLSGLRTFNGYQDQAVDGTLFSSRPNYINTLFDSSIFNLTAGVTVYLGKNKQHVDWVRAEYAQKSDIPAIPKDYGEEIQALQTRLKALESRPNIDEASLKNRISELEKQIDDLNKETKRKMDDNVIHAYFDFDKDQPQSPSLPYIQTAIDYLKNNPAAKMELIGYADNIGTAEYNEDLSKRRVENIQKLMVISGISHERLSLSWKGSKDANVKTAKERALARKVVFRVTY